MLLNEYKKYYKSVHLVEQMNKSNTFVETSIHCKILDKLLNLFEPVLIYKISQKILDFKCKLPSLAHRK